MIAMNEMRRQPRSRKKAGPGEKRNLGLRHAITVAGNTWKEIKRSGSTAT
jgi:hypothetical protein